MYSIWTFTGGDRLVALGIYGVWGLSASRPSMTMGMLEPSEGETMELSADQIRAVASGEAVSITVEQTPCVLIRVDLYDWVRALLDIEAAYPLVDETFQEG